MKVKLKIYRHNPDSQEDFKYDNFEIDSEPGETVLSALQKIYEECDPGLSFRFACGKVKCGECAMMVNKLPCLACNKIIEPELVIEPLPNLPLIKDLVINRNKALKRIFELAPFLLESIKASQVNELSISDIIDLHVKLTSCYECLICQSICPVRKKNPDQFAGPLALVWLAQMKLTGSHIPPETVDMVKMCTNCGRCWKVCPSEVKFLEPAIAGLLNE